MTHVVYDQQYQNAFQRIEMFYRQRMGMKDLTLPRRVEKKMEPCNFENV
jgi:hypothetical protein